MSEWHQRRKLVLECPLCTTQSVRLQNHTGSNDRRNDFRLRCEICEFHSPGWIYDHGRTIESYIHYWKELTSLFAQLQKPCIFCSLKCDPWYASCSACFLKNEMLEQLIKIDKKNKRIKEKLGKI